MNNSGPYLVGALKDAFAKNGRPLRGRYRYYQEFDSYFSDADISPDEQSAELINWHHNHTKGSWGWEFSHHKVFDADGKIIDVKPWLIISFDLSGDAMLSRMTWPDLKKLPSAKRRRRARDTS